MAELINCLDCLGAVPADEGVVAVNVTADLALGHCAACYESLARFQWSRSLDIQQLMQLILWVRRRPAARFLIEAATDPAHEHD